MKLYLSVKHNNQVAVGVKSDNKSHVFFESDQTYDLIDHLIRNESFEALTAYATEKNINDIAYAVKVSSMLTGVKIYKLGNYITDEITEILLTLLDALKHNPRIIDAEIVGYHGPKVFRRAFEVFTTLPLISLNIVTRHPDIQISIDDAMLLYEIKTLKILRPSIYEFDTRTNAQFLSKMLELVSVLDLSVPVSGDETEVIASALATNTSPVEILTIDIRDGLELFGEALKTNTRLKSLSLGGARRVTSRSIFDGLVHNESLLKLDIYVYEADVSSLIRMLQTNTMLEHLKLKIDFNLHSHRELALALANSSIVDLYIRNRRQPKNFITTLLDGLRTNTTLRHLRTDVSGVEIDGHHIVELVTQNSTLETLILNGVSVDDIDGDDIKNNGTLTKVWSRAPHSLLHIARRNERNKLVRDSSLFGLTSHVMR